MAALPCKKKRHETRGAAILFQQEISMPFYEYKCSRCGGWHITTTGISEGALSEIGEAIRQGDSDCLEQLSNYRSIHEVQHRIGTFRVLYHKRKMRVTILEETTGEQQ